MIDREQAIKVVLRDYDVYPERAEGLVDLVLRQPDPVHEAARELLEVLDASSPPIAEPETPRLRARAKLRAALSTERVSTERDRRAEKWLTDQHSSEWYIGDATDAEWDAAYTAVDAERVPTPITDEMVERAAMALWNVVATKDLGHREPYPFGRLIPETVADLNDYARAALDAALNGGEGWR